MEKELIKLPEDFELEKYGLYVRLVREDDAQFILSLRNDPKLTRFIHDTDPDINKQKAWIREYKKREITGKDYYFIYFYEDAPIGLNRIYDIKNDGTFNSGSWVFKESPYQLASVAASCITLEIAFEKLGLLLNLMPDGVHVDNKAVIKFNLMLGAEITGEIEDIKGIYYQMKRTKENFYIAENKILKFLNI